MQGLSYSLKPVYTLFSAKTGFYGRSLTGKSLPLINFEIKDKDFVMFNTRVNDPELHVVIELLLEVK